MNTDTQSSRISKSSGIPFGDRFLAAVVGGFAVALLFLVVFTLILTIIFAGRVLPGITIAGVIIMILGKMKGRKNKAGTS